MYVRVSYYMKNKSKRKLKIRNIKLSKISLPMVINNLHCNWSLFLYLKQVQQLRIKHALTAQT